MNIAVIGGDGVGKSTFVQGALDLPFPAPEKTIFFFEAFVVLCAIRYAAAFTQPQARILIYSDNFNTVNMFNSFSAKPEYYEILIEAADMFKHHSMDAQILHVNGADNLIADLLSRKQFAEINKLCPYLACEAFQPAPPCRAGSQ